MIPVLGVPVISRPDLLRRFVASIDYAVGTLVIIDNSPTGDMADGMDLPECVTEYVVTLAPRNLGVAASWNLLLRAFATEPWVCIANADTVLGEGDLERLAEEMDLPAPRWVGMNGDWRVFGINQACVDAVGLFDENFHPIYCEDADYERRCDLAGVPWYFLSGGATHEGSTTILSDRDYAEANARTYPENRAYYRAKWGGELRGGETFTTPFDAGGSVRDWTLDLARLRGLAW